MVFRRRRNKAARAENAVGDYDEAATNRLRSIGESGGYTFSPDERSDVEARIRRMWLGAKKEGSKAEPQEDDS